METESCYGLSNPDATTLALQFAHCVSDFLIFLPELIDEQIFIYHHAVLLIASTILPYCPGCIYTTIAYTMAEFGSGAIAVDAEWRKKGGYSRGLKRVVIFGASRLINLYLLYKLYLVTPSSTYFTVTNEGQEIFTVNLPVCMITSVGGSTMLLIVNGVTWFRMFLFYRKFKKKRMAAKKQAGESEKEHVE
mmetsp:Transcript_167/g.213  ORF Transcript_167/g.213 Transcript_167/m.213 type:complete len:191 (-) Transcript_167:331-903(-)